MKKYLAPELEKIEYDVLDCLNTSGNPAGAGIGREGGDIDDLLGDL